MNEHQREVDRRKKYFAAALRYRFPHIQQHEAMEITIAINSAMASLNTSGDTNRVRHLKDPLLAMMRTHGHYPSLNVPPPTPENIHDLFGNEAKK